VVAGVGRWIAWSTRHAQSWFRFGDVVRGVGIVGCVWMVGRVSRTKLPCVVSTKLLPQ